MKSQYNTRSWSIDSCSFRGVPWRWTSRYPWLAGSYHNLPNQSAKLDGWWRWISWQSTLWPKFTWLGLWCCPWRHHGQCQSRPAPECWSITRTCMIQRLHLSFWGSKHNNRTLCLLRGIWQLFSIQLSTSSKTIFYSHNCPFMPKHHRSTRWLRTLRQTRCCWTHPSEWFQEPYTVTQPWKLVLQEPAAYSSSWCIEEYLGCTSWTYSWCPLSFAWRLESVR